MKKLFTLFMATVVVMSMMALPQDVKLAGKKAKPASKEQFEAKNPAQAKVLEMAKDAKVLRDFKRIEKEVKKVPAKSPLKAAAAQTANTIKLHFNGFYTVPEWNEESSDWYMVCYNGEGWIVEFDILAESYVGTFTESDLDLWSSYMYTSEYYYVFYEKVALTITETVKSQYCKVLNLHAVIDGSDGNVYEVTCEHSFLSPKAEVSHTITGATMSYDDMKELATLAGKNADLDMTLAYVASWPTGRYTKGDLDMTATNVSYKGIEQQLLDVDMLVKSDMVDGTLSYVADVNYYDQDTVLNKVSITAPLAPATDTVNIEILNLQVDESWAAYFDWVYLTGANNEWDISAGVTSLVAEEGEWAGEEEVMLIVTDKVNSEETEAIYATAKMVKDDEKGWLVSLEGYCTDGRYYVVDMKFEIPEPTIFKTITFENSCKATYDPTSDHYLLLENKNEDIAVGIGISGVPMGGTFTYDQIYSYLTDGDEEVMIGAVEGKVYQVGDTTRMDVVIKGFNAVQYTIELWYAVPTPKEIIELIIPKVEFKNLLNDFGIYQLYGYSADGKNFAKFTIVTDQVEGTFVNDGKFGGFGAEDGAYDFWQSDTYILNSTNLVTKGSLTVAMDEDGDIIATGSVICSNAVQYNVTLLSTYKQCGDHLFWKYNDSSLEIFGYGNMYNYARSTDIPWANRSTAWFTLDDIKYLQLPDGMTTISKYAFNECRYLSSVVIPSSVEAIYASAFEDCRKLEEVVFEDNSKLNLIGDWAFYNCHLLKTLEIPEGVKTLGYGAFYGCTYLQELTLPSTLESLDDVSFALCAKLQKMNVDATVPPTVNARTFEDVNRSIPVYVPTESVPAYKAAPVWQEFNIQPKDGVTSGLSDIQSTTTDIQKLIRNGQIYIYHNGSVYNIMGQKVSENF